ncbi:MAG: thiazole biosynthesis protein ThiJ [Candidatus Hydrogenedentota bacterium]
MPSVLIPLAEGFEELEAVTIIDLLRRADVDVVTAGLKNGPVTGSRKTVLSPDTTLDAALKRKYDMVALPGGLPGSEHLKNDERIRDLVVAMAEQGKYTCAICAAPMVLAAAGLLDGKRATCYPGVFENLNMPDVKSTGAAVERDGTIITSRGPGTAMDFALALIEAICGKAKRDTVEKGLVRN